LKDRKKSSDFNAIRTNIGLNNYPWGQGDPPIKPLLQLLKAEKYPFPADIEYEYGCRTTGRRQKKWQNAWRMQRRRSHKRPNDRSRLRGCSFTRAALFIPAPPMLRV
jgi:hypothetical protein